MNYPKADCKMMLDKARTNYTKLRHAKADVPLLRAARKEVTTWEARLRTAMLKRN